MADYSKDEIKRIEEKWRSEWEKRGVYQVTNDTSKPKYYVLDMFPYPSGAGLHVGHPLGYIASDIVSRYKRIKGFNVLHPMGFDAFGLPAEQYAIQTGQHPAITTAKNIDTYKKQLRQIGFSYDWSREVQTCDPSYYKWTQWIFMQLFNAWYNNQSEGASLGKAEPIDTLIAELEKNGNQHIVAVCDEETPQITAQQWKNFSEKERENFLQHYRLAYLSETMVNWCAALGTVLSNDEVKDGVSERGGYPVERKKMMQWSMRITAYAERLLRGLDTIDWPEPLKEMQRNWIGKSMGAQFFFQVDKSSERIEVFTTRIDTIFGVTFVVLAPEHELVEKITPASHIDLVRKYVEVAKNRSERERMSEVKRVSGEFTGAYVIHPFTGKQVPIWISDYVLAGYGTGAVMAVPGHDERDHRFAKHFNLPIVQVVEGPSVEEEAFVSWEAKIINSDFLNGLVVDDAIAAGIKKLEEMGIGTGKVNYRMRDAIFGRQRYWGEPFPVYYKDGLPQLVDEQDLPVTLPEINEYKPTETGEPPLARAKGWGYKQFDLTPNPSPKERGTSGEAMAQDFVFTTDPQTWERLKAFARENRQAATPAEDALWQAIRNSQLGYKFRRQHAIGPFIVDFVCIEKRLVVELDGEIHNYQQREDAERTSIIESLGFRVMRFTNNDVLDTLAEVLQKIKIGLTSPSPVERGHGGEVTYPFELTTMPGWAGSSWYWFRYMDPRNEKEFVGRKEVDYWKDVDLYIGGSEHATGHLLYSRFWCKVLKDLGHVGSEEPFKKLINQGHIQGVSQKISVVGGGPDLNTRVNTIYVPDFGPQPISLGDGLYTIFLSSEIEQYPHNTYKVNVPIEYVTIENNSLNVVRYLEFRNDLQRAVFVTTNGYQIFEKASGEWRLIFENFKDERRSIYTKPEIEKMSKSKFNVVNPDQIVNDYGADTLRMYEMFLGPLEASKPWSTQGIDGVFKFLRRFWNLFHDGNGNFRVSDAEPTREELKVLHKTIKKVEQDINNFSFNTSVSEFMICANELTSMKCNKRSVLEPLVIALSPFAPHIAEELWEKLGHKDSILLATYPASDEQYLTESSFNYPISINGKVRAQMQFALDMPKEDIEKWVLASEAVQKWSEGKPPKKVIIVPGKIVNIVV